MRIPLPLKGAGTMLDARSDESLLTAQPTDTDLREALGGNLCRCGSYLKILEACRAPAGE